MEKVSSSSVVSNYRGAGGKFGGGKGKKHKLWLEISHLCNQQCILTKCEVLTWLNKQEGVLCVKIINVLNGAFPKRSQTVRKVKLICPNYAYLKKKLSCHNTCVLKSANRV